MNPKTAQRAAFVAGVLTLGLSATRVRIEGLDSQVGWVLGVAAFAFLAVSASARWLAPWLTAYAVPVIGLAALGSMSWVEGGLRSEAIVWLPFTPIAAALLSGERASVAAGLAATAIAGALWAQQPADALHFAGTVGAIWFGAALAIIYDRGRRATLAATAEREVRLRRLLDSIPLCTLVLDEQGALIHQSNLRAALSDRDAQALEREAHLSAAPPQLRSAVESSAHGGSVSVDYGEGIQQRVLAIRVLPFEGMQRIVVVTDESDIARIARLKDEFVSTVSHEIRTPLASTAGALALLARSPHIDRDSALLDVAMRNTDRLKRLVDDLLDLQKLEAGHLDVKQERVEVGAIVNAVIDELRPLAMERHVRITVDAQGPVHALADGDRLHQILVNLMGNAVRHTGQQVRLRMWEEDAQAHVAVADDGPGIPTEMLSRIFDRFVQVDTGLNRSTSGSGLGLAISHTLAEHMGGSLAVRSAVGAGSTFTVSLRSA